MNNEERDLTLKFKRDLLLIKEKEAKKLFEEGIKSVESFFEPGFLGSYGSAIHPFDMLRKALQEIDELRDQVKELEDEKTFIY